MSEWEDIGKLISSRNRREVLKSLIEGEKTPIEMCESTKIHPSNISKILKDLEKMNLIICVNPKLRKGRLYRITTYGQKINNEIKNRKGRQ